MSSRWTRIGGGLLVASIASTCLVSCTPVDDVSVKREGASWIVVFCDAATVERLVAESDAEGSSPKVFWEADGSGEIGPQHELVVGAPPEGFQNVTFDPPELAGARVWITAFDVGSRTYSWIGEADEVVEDRWLGAAGSYQSAPCS